LAIKLIPFIFRAVKVLLHNSKTMLLQLTCLNDSNKSSTRCNSFSSLLLDFYLQLNMFRTSCRPSSGAQQLQ